MTEFELPGAEQFSAYLRERVRGILSLTLCSETPMRVEGVNYARKWIVSLDGKRIGEYLTSDPNQDNEKPSRRYYGRVPGYVNEAIQSRSSQEEQTPKDLVTLVYTEKSRASNVSAEDDITNTFGQRQDFHKEIPFP